MELSLKVVQDLGNIKIVTGYKKDLYYLLHKAEKVFALLHGIKGSAYTLIYNYYDILTNEDTGEYKRLNILRDFLGTLTGDEDISAENETAYFDLARRCNYTFTSMWSKISASVTKEGSNITSEEAEVVKKLNNIMSVLTVKIPLIYLDNMGYEECQKYMRNFNIRLTKQDKQDIDMLWELSCVTMSWYNVIISLDNKSKRLKEILYETVSNTGEEFCNKLLECKL